MEECKAMKRSNIVVRAVLSSLAIAFLAHCSADDAEPTAVTGEQGGTGGIAPAGGQGGQGGVATGGTSMSQAGHAGTSGANASGGASSANASAGAGVAGTTLADSAVVCTASLPAGTLHGSCDARATAGDSKGQCREWYGSPNPSLTFACPNGEGQYSPSVGCPTESRVGRCRLPFLTLDVETVLVYYAPVFDAASAKRACAQVGGTCIP